MAIISDSDLLDWLDNDPVRLESHLSRFPSDIERLDLLTELDDALRDGLREWSTPDPEFVSRLVSRLEGMTPIHEASSYLLDLLCLPGSTARYLMEGEN